MISCKWWMDVRLIALNKNENLTKVQQFCSMSVSLFIPLKICNPSCVNFHTKIFFCCLIAVVYVPFQRNAFKLKEKMQFTKGANKLIVHVVSTRLLNPWHHLQSECHSIHLMVDVCVGVCVCVADTLWFARMKKWLGFFCVPWRWTRHRAVLWLSLRKCNYMEFR